MPDAHSVYCFVIGHLQAALEVLALGIAPKLLSVCTVLKVQLNGADRVIDSTSDLAQESLGHLDSGAVRN